MTHRTNGRTYVAHPAIQPPQEDPGPHVIIDVSQFSQPNIPPPPKGPSSPARMHNAYSRTYGALGNKPTAESLLTKIEALKNAKNCPELIDCAKLELDLAKLQTDPKQREYYLVEAHHHLRIALTQALQYTFGETLKLMWLGQITAAHNDLKTYAKEYRFDFSELKPIVIEPPKAPKLPAKIPAQHSTITRVAGGIIALLGLVFISGLVIHRFLVKKRIA